MKDKRGGRPGPSPRPSPTPARPPVGRGRHRPPAEAEGHLPPAEPDGLEAARGHLRAGREARAAGDLDAAARKLRAAVAKGETLALAWAELGQVLLALGEDEDAAVCYERALRLAWRHHRLGRWATAKRVYRAAGNQPPELPRPDRQVTELARRRSVADAPRARALCNLGQVLLHAERRPSAARACFERARELDPECGHAWVGLGEVEREEAPERAEPLYRHARDLLPAESAKLGFELLRLRAELCDWRRRDADVAELAALVEAERPAFELPPFELNHFPLPPRLHLRAARRYAARRAVRRHFRHHRSAGGRRRVGYLSPDFRTHAVGRLIWDLFRHHDRERFEVFAYSLVDADDPIRDAVEAGCDHFVNLSRDAPEDAARRIHADAIDVLVDLGGYSSHTRPEILAHRPAPVQVSWLGYADTLGAPWTPWVIADPIAVPEELAACYSEEVLYLPGCFLASSPITPPAGAPPRAACGLPENGVVFACFNHPTRIGPEVFAAWMRVLRRVDGSVLWLYDRGLASLRQNLRLEADARGVDPRRLVFARAVPRERHLARLRRVDVALDTFFYNGGATSLDALRAGAPLITAPGETFLGRMGASLCTAAGTPETVCATPEEYEDTAARLAARGHEWTALRARLGDALADGPLFDLPRFVEQLESIYDSLLPAAR